MDSKFLRVTLLVSMLFMATIFFVVLYANGIGPGQKKNDSKPVETETQDVVLSGQIGNDLYGWMEDENFFDQVEITQVMEEGAVKVSVIASSVEKDLRVCVVDPAGKPIKGKFFEIVINEKEKYLDLDRDGIIMVPDLKAGEYQVALSKEEGYVVPAGSVPVKVKDRVEYVAINDTFLNIKAEEDVDALEEDLGQIPEETDASEPTELVNSAVANLGIAVSGWNGDINWNKIKESGIEYALIRVGYRGSVSGALVEDKNFRKNVEGALKAGVPVGLYFITQATTAVEAVEEASMVLSLCKDYDITYPVFVDTRDGGGDRRADGLNQKNRTAICMAFCETIRNEGYKAGIHADKRWFDEKLDTGILSDNMYVWLAEYGSEVTFDKEYHIWQYTSSGRVLGIEGKVDVNLSFLDPEDLE